MNKLFTITLALVFGLFMAGTSHASYGSEVCTPIYGGGQTCETSSKFTLDKKVLHPDALKGEVKNFVDNLTINDPKYFSNQIIEFELNVTNTGTETLNELALTDIMPSFVIFNSGPGTYDKDSNTLKLQIVNLNPGETRKYIIIGTIVEDSALPSGQGITCVVNQASVVFDNDESKDVSQFCIERVTMTKGGTPVMAAPEISETPDTGAGMLSLIGLIPAAVGGFVLRRKAK